MINLYNRDCMEAMLEAPDNYWDLAIVDPPYGIGEDGKKNWTRGGLASPTKFKNKNWDKQAPTKAYFEELKRVSKNQIIFGANHFIERIGKNSACWIVWDKINYGTDFADCELAWTSFKSSVRLFRFQWNGMIQGNMKQKQKRIHPTQKPIQLYEWLLSKYAKKGDKILDTHLGSGSSAIAAHRMGFTFDGYEIDKDYFEGAKARLEQAQRQLLLFG